MRLGFGMLFPKCPDLAMTSMFFDGHHMMGIQSRLGPTYTWSIAILSPSLLFFVPIPIKLMSHHGLSFPPLLSPAHPHH